MALGKENDNDNWSAMSMLEGRECQIKAIKSHVSWLLLFIYRRWAHVMMYGILPVVKMLSSG